MLCLHCCYHDRDYLEDCSCDMIFHSLLTDNGKLDCYVKIAAVAVLSLNFKPTQRSLCRAGRPGSRCHRLHHNPAFSKPTHKQKSHLITIQSFSNICVNVGETVTPVIAVPPEPWMWRCNMVSSTSRFQPWAVWRNWNRRSWWILGVHCHQRSGCYRASGLDAQPDKTKDQTRVLVCQVWKSQKWLQMQWDLNILLGNVDLFTSLYVYRLFSICLTPWECKYSTVLVSVHMMSDASLSVKFGCVRTLSSSSFPLGTSRTKKTFWPSSNTFRQKKTHRNEAHFKQPFYRNYGSLVYLVQHGSLCCTYIPQSNYIRMLPIS